MVAIVNESVQRKHRQMFTAMDKERQTWFTHWRMVSDYFLPRRYPWLMTKREQQGRNRLNSKLLSSVSTMAVRTLASGMSSGITSPSRPWFMLRIEGFDPETLTHAVKVYLEEVRRRLLQIFAESNFYNSMAIMYLEWCTFGTASMMIYEDFEDVIRCYNYSLGEFYLSQDETQRINRHARNFTLTVEQIVGQFGEDAVREETLNKFKRGGAALLEEVLVSHIVEENDPDDGLTSANAKWREVYWEGGAEVGVYLDVKPFFEWPCVTPRWEIYGSDSYGTSPAMDALGDSIQLQDMLKQRGMGLKKQLSPPMIVDNQLRNRPKALGANGVTYASSANSNFGAKPAVQINTPLQEMAADIRDLGTAIRETCHNDLFNMISNLDTVRSALEISELTQERLVHLGSVLTRFNNEGLDTILTRTFGIASRAGLMPEAPPELEGKELSVQYVGVLAEAQRAASTITTERFLGFIGELSPVYPEVRNVPNPSELIRDYADALGIKPTGINSREDVAAAEAAEAEQQQLAQAAELGGQLAQGAKALSETDVGGGVNALQAALG